MNTVTSRDGTMIAYDKIGQGPALILVDGALCRRQFGPMPKLASLLQEHFTVFTYDRRGRGDSTDVKPYTVQREVEDIEALIKEAGGSAFAFGISSGAVLALTAAEKRLKIPKVGMYEPPYVREKGQPANFESELNRIIASNRRSDAVKYFMTTMVGVPAIVNFIMRFMPMWKKLKAVAHTLPYDAAVMGDFTLPAERISRITVSTLIAGGGKSPATLRNAVQSVAAALPNKTLKVLEGQTHNVKAEVLAPVLVEFFNS